MSQSAQYTKKRYTFFQEALLEITPFPLELIDIVNQYLTKKKAIRHSLYHTYFDLCFKFDVIIEGDQFYIIPMLQESYFYEAANQENRLSSIYFKTCREIIHDNKNNWLRYINAFSENSFLCLNRQLFLRYRLNEDLFPSTRFEQILDSTINIAKEYEAIPGLMYMKLLLDSKIAAYFRALDTAEIKVEAMLNHSPEQYFSWLEKVQKIMESEVSKTTGRKEDLPFNLLKRSIRLNIFLTAVVIKIFRIESMIYEKVGAQGWSYSKYGFKITTPIIHSLKHNLFKSEHEIDYALYIRTLKELVEDLYSAKLQTKARTEFTEFDQEIAQVKILLDLGCKKYAMSNDSPPPTQSFSSS